MSPMHALVHSLLLPALLVGASPASSQASDAAAQRVRAHVEFLSDDLLEGRDTGSRGLAIASAYVASQFRALGLEPGGTDGSWYQQVPFRRASHAGPATFAYTVGGRTTELVAGRDAMIRPSLLVKKRSIDAPLVFVGRGISEPRLGIDDYAGLDVRGKIVVAIEGMPPGLPTEIAAHLDDNRADVAAAKGAVGYIAIAPDRGRSAVQRYGRPLLDWVEGGTSTGPNARGIHNGIALSDEWAERLFEQAPKRLSALRSDARRGRPIAGFALPGRLRVQATSEWQEFTSPETIGLLRGSDPAIADEYVILMGHLDHLGIRPDAKPGEDAIFNGALDNAAGVATLIEAAHAFVASGRRPRRSILFITNTGEERNLLGADYFAAHPTVPLDKIVAVVDLDMPLLRYDFTDVTAFGADHSTVARTIAEAGRAMGVAVSPDPMPEEALFVRSDHYRFVLRGVPAVLLMTGHANGGKAAWRRYLDTVYHKPIDDVAQPIDWRAGAKYGELNYRIARALADADRRPLWYRGDYFGDTFAPGQPRAER